MGICQTSHVAVAVEKLQDMVEAKQQWLDTKIADDWRYIIGFSIGQRKALRCLLWWLPLLTEEQARLGIQEEIDRGRRCAPEEYWGWLTRRLARLRRMCILSADGVVHLSHDDLENL